MKFQIPHQSLTDFFRNYHSDVVDRPEWNNGDVTGISAGRFDTLAREIWKLQLQSYSSPYYRFDVLDANRVREIGLARYGEFI